MFYIGRHFLPIKAAVNYGLTVVSKVHLLPSAVLLFLNLLFLETEKLPPEIYGSTQTVNKFSATQMSTSATSQISSDPQLNAPSA